ncbi:MAG TPA: HAD family hydrolase [Deltaproteobacteria bacterium]|nr:HAD family hydrolase [Deltaproteobacteria bacterium]
MKNKKAVIFDLDGTLLDTLTDIADSMNEVLARYGFPVHDYGAYRTMIGAGMDVLARRAVPEDRRDDETVSRVAAAMREEYDRRWSLTSRPYPGVPEMLTLLTERGIPFSVLSNKLDSFAKQMVSALLGDWNFFEVRGLVQGLPRKPDPHIALEMADSLGLPAEQVIFVGDSDIDMETAVRAGMVPVGVLWGYQTPERLTSAGAFALLSSPRELLGIL